MKKICLLILAISFCLSVVSQVRIITIGDSTMADYDENINSGAKEQRGWAQMLPAFLTDEVTLENVAKNGRSSKSFYFEYWRDLRETLKKGDYVIIQFGHNDEKNDGQDTDETNEKERGTAPWGQYQKYLRMYIDETRQKGAIPILVTPVVRCMFSGAELAPKGRHSLSEYCGGNDSLLNYPMAMKAVALEKNVPLVDMTTLTQELVEDYGVKKSTEIIYVNTDKTHLKAMGGILFSELFVNDMISKKILAEYFKPSDGIYLTPAFYDYANQPIGYSSVRTISLLGLQTKGFQKDIEVSVNEPFSISLSPDAEFKKSQVIKAGNDLFTKHLYVKFTPKKEQEYKQVLSVKESGRTLAVANLQGKGMKIGKEEISLLSWNPSKGESVSSSKYKVSSSLAGLELHNRKGQQVITTLNNKWPAQEIDMDAGRYIEFTLRGGSEDVYISNLSFDLNSIGGGQMYFTALGSTDPWFKQQESFAVMERMDKDVAKKYNFKTMIKLEAGKTFYVRIYPWYKSDKELDAKYILLQNIELKGIISE